MLKVFILSLIIVLFALVGLSIKLILDKKAVFKGSSCSAASNELREKGIGDCCGGSCSAEKD
ncbi:MAG: hypothetical protein H6540_06705 [Bacteroidales bacterium]|nr:hypothetical protein [Bacteroidales bacterium]